MLVSVCIKFGKLSSGYRTGKDQFSFQSQRKAMLKNVQISVQQHSFQMLASAARFRKGRGIRAQIANIHWLIEKAREFLKTFPSAALTVLKAFDCVDHNKLWKILRDGNTGVPYLPPEKPLCRSRSNRTRHETIYVFVPNQELVPNWERNTSRLYIVTLLI